MAHQLNWNSIHQAFSLYYGHGNYAACLWQLPHCWLNHRSYYKANCLHSNHFVNQLYENKIPKEVLIPNLPIIAGFEALNKAKDFQKSVTLEQWLQQTSMFQHSSAHFTTDILFDKDKLNQIRILFWKISFLLGD